MAIIIKRRAAPEAAPATPLAALIQATGPAATLEHEPENEPAVSLASVEGQPSQTKVATLPWEDNPSAGGDYNLLDALKELADGRKGHLFIRKDFTDTRYEVIHYDPATCQAKLKTVDGGMLTPVVGMREAMIYSPEWR